MPGQLIFGMIRRNRLLHAKFGKSRERLSNKEQKAASLSAGG